MSNKLDGKIAVVTGASAGIGLGIAKAFAAEGAKVYITGRRQSELDKALAEIGHGAVGVQGGRREHGRCRQAIRPGKATDGRIDVLALNAGYYEFEKFGEITEEHFDKTLQHQREGPAVHPAEGAAPAPQGRLGDPDRLDRQPHRHPGDVGLLLDQGGDPQPDAGLDPRHQGTGHSASTC